MSDHETPESAESILQSTRAIKIMGREKAVNAYLKAGWTLIKTYLVVADEEGSQQVHYVMAWRLPGKPKTPRIR